jgi:hypothetical protein
MLVSITLVVLGISAVYSYLPFKTLRLEVAGYYGACQIRAHAGTSCLCTGRRRVSYPPTKVSLIVSSPVLFRQAHQYPEQSTAASPTSRSYIDADPERTRSMVSCTNIRPGTTAARDTGNGAFPTGVGRATSVPLPHHKPNHGIKSVCHELAAYVDEETQLNVVLQVGRNRIAQRLWPLDFLL